MSLSSVARSPSKVTRKSWPTRSGTDIASRRAWAVAAGSGGSSWAAEWACAACEVVCSSKNTARRTAVPHTRQSVLTRSHAAFKMNHCSLNVEIKTSCAGSLRQSGVFAHFTAVGGLPFPGPKGRSDAVHYTVDCLTNHLCYNFYLLCTTEIFTKSSCIWRVFPR